MEESECRLCLKKENNHINIFKNDVDSDINSLINVCMGLLIREDDGITTFICRQCFYMVKAFSELRSTAIHNNLRLKLLQDERKKLQLIQNKCETTPEVIVNKQTNIFSKSLTRDESNVSNQNETVCEVETRTVKEVAVGNIKDTIQTITTEIVNIDKNIQVPVELPVNDKNTVLAPIEVEVESIKTVTPTETVKDVDKTTTVASIENQENFMSQLNLVNSSKPIKQKDKCRFRKHPSINKMIRMFPNINIPKKCYKWHIDPIVIVNNKIVDDWLLQNDKMDKKKPNSWTVNHAENNEFGLSFIRVPENLKNLLDNFENDQIDSSSKSDSSFSLNSLKGDTDSDTSIFTAIKEKSRKRMRKINGPASKRSKLNKNKDNNELIDAETLATMRQNILEVLTKPQLVGREDGKVTEEIASTSLQTELPVTDENMQLLVGLIQHDRLLSESEKEDSTNLLFETSHASKTYICQTCNAIFYTIKTFNEHRKNHNKNTLPCQKCPLTFALVEELVKHNLEVHAIDDEKEKEELQKRMQNRIAKKSTSKERKRKYVDPNVLKNVTITRNLPEINDAPSTSKVIEQFVISSDEDDTTASIVKPTEINQASSLLKTPVESTTKPQSRSKNLYFPMIANTDETMYLKNVFSKVKNMHALKNKTKTEPKVLKNKCGNVVLAGIEKLLGKAYIPVETVAKFGEPDIKLRYTLPLQERARPRNTSYKWPQDKIIDAPNIPLVEYQKVVNVPEKKDETPKPLVSESTPTNQNSQSPFGSQSPEKARYYAKMLPNGTLQLLPTTPKVLLTQMTSNSSCVVPASVDKLNSWPLQPKNIYSTPKNNFANKNEPPTSNVQSFTINVNNSLPTDTSKSLLSGQCTQNTLKPVESPKVTNVQLSTPQNVTGNTANINLQQNRLVPLSNLTMNPTFSTLNSPPGLILFRPNAQQSNINVHNFISINVPTTSSTTMPQSSNFIPTTILTTQGQSESFKSNTESIPSRSPQAIQPKPMLRIKNITELTDNSNNTQNQDRRALKSIYAEAVSKYVNAYADNHNKQNSLDEYLQI